MPRLRPAFCATFLPGFATVPAVERVMAFDVEVLEANHVEPAGEVGAGLLGPVLAPVAVFGFHPLRSGPAPCGGGWTRGLRGRVCDAAAAPARLPSGSARQDWSSHPWTAPPRA